MKKRTFLALLLIIAFLLPTVMSSISATETTQTANVMTDSTRFSPAARVSGWGTPAIDGTLDTDIYQSYSKVQSNFNASTSYYPKSSSFNVYYANDGDYVYFYLTVTLEARDALSDDDIARFYVDFYNQHQVYNKTNNAYMKSYLEYNTKLYNGGQFQFYGAGKVSGGRGAENKLGTMGTDYKFVAKTNDDSKVVGYTIEGRFTLPDYVKTAIAGGKQPIISIGYEIRNNNTDKYYTSYGDVSKAALSAVENGWGDYTIAPDVLLSIEDSTKNVIDLTKYRDNSVLSDSVFLGAGSKASGYGTPTIDGVLDIEVYKAYSKVESNYHLSNTTYTGTAPFTVYYANDGDYLYFYMNVDLPDGRTALDNNDSARLYIDFYNNHIKVYNTDGNDYMTAYFKDNTTYNGGQFEYLINNPTGGTRSRGASNGVGTYGTDYTFSSNKDSTGTYVTDYSVEGRIKLPDYVKSSIARSEQPVISINYEVRNKGTEPKFVSYYGDSEIAPIGRSTIGYGDYSIAADVVLSIADSTKNVTDITLYNKGRTLQTGETLTAGTRTSGYGTPVIDGTFDSDIYKSYSKVESNTKLITAGADASFNVYYANDGDYLYFYLSATLPAEKTALDGKDLARLYIDFYNKHTSIYDITDNEYMNLYLNNNATYHGGQFQYYINSGSADGGRGASNGLGTKGTDYKVIINYSDEAKTDVSDYVLEGRIKLPDYVKKEIANGEQPVISIGYEARNNATAPTYGFGYADSEIATSIGNGWADYTLYPDVVLSTSATPRTVGFQKSAVKDGKYDLRFAAVIDDYTKFDKAGFVFTYVAGPDTAMVGKTAEVDCWSVYTSITANGKTVNATDLGGKYFICFTIKGLTDGQAYTFDVTSRTQAKGMTAWAIDKTAQIKITADGNFS